MGEYFTPIYGRTDLDEDELKRTLEIIDNEQVEINLQFLSEDPNFFLNIGYEDAEEISKSGKTAYLSDIEVSDRPVYSDFIKRFISDSGDLKDYFISMVENEVVENLGDDEDNRLFPSVHHKHLNDDMKRLRPPNPCLSNVERIILNLGEQRLNNEEHPACKIALLGQLEPIYKKRTKELKVEDIEEGHFFSAKFTLLMKNDGRKIIEKIASALDLEKANNT